MNTIERIEARRSQPSCHDQTEWLRITAGEWAAIKAVVERAGRVHSAFAEDGISAASTHGDELQSLGEALSKLEGE